MNFLTFSMSGAELRSGPHLRTIDFAVASNDSTLLFFCTWDLSDQLSPGIDGDFYVVDGHLVEDERGGFLTSAGELVSTHSDEDGLLLFEKTRSRIRCAKSRYLNLLRSLASIEVKYDFSPVISYFEALPTITPANTLGHARRKRDILGIRAFDHNGVPVDSLVIDEDGLVAVFADNGPLSRAVSVLSTTPGLNTPQAARKFFLNWQPSGYVLEDLKLTNQGGSIDDLALRVFAGTL